ncbi:MAG: hypothetical protein QOG35_1074 [Solirubrobacteraceae bacterium]|nr:hypothetical protein [Solirubrobacteraceae bacterium]
MFERFAPSARQVVALAQEEARALEHHHVGAEHLLLGVVRVERAILAAGPDDIRARIGRGPGGVPGWVAFTGAAKAALERAANEALRRGHPLVVPAHLLLALAAEPEALLASGSAPDRLRAAAERRLEATAIPRFDLEATMRAGAPIPVWLGDRELPIGDLGNPRVDGRILLAMLALGGRSAALLRGHGVDETAVRQDLPS